MDHDFKVVTMDKSILNRYLDLPMPKDMCLLEYIWVDGTGMRLRCKQMEVEKTPESPEDCPPWAVCGYGTDQADGEEEEMYLKPVRLYQDPFERANHKLVLCLAIHKSGNPAKANYRVQCKEAMEAAASEKPWFTFEQEYYIVDPETNKPLGWPRQGNAPTMGPSYCSIGAGKENGREIARAHYRACRYAGIKLSGLNQELAWGQWEYQCGITEGIQAADDLWMSRYILERVAAEFGYKISLDPKPIILEINGMGLHCNFSTKSTRDERVGKFGLEIINQYIKKLEANHMAHLKVYDGNGGEDNKLRLSGIFIDTVKYDQFKSGVAARNVSIRIPKTTYQNGFGYLEDRRPASNADPYLVCEAMVRTCVLGR
ncbi:glutamine synthetase-like [Brevipalpus obovatus]|uniref:glutamine synthetase-like n=1 Tax=Brevipalpus obovatus TaxID=246614 RepID=UPI003D9E9CDB